jgi:hypothetical protein
MATTLDRMREPFQLDGDPLAYADGSTLLYAVPIRRDRGASVETLDAGAFVALAEELAKYAPGQRDDALPEAKDARLYALSVKDATAEGSKEVVATSEPQKATAEEPSEEPSEEPAEEPAEP